jgi:hypothetical protein
MAELTIGNDDLCPWCERVCPIVDVDPILGEIYECFHCKREIENQFGGITITKDPYTWAVVDGEKKEVIG